MMNWHVTAGPPQPERGPWARTDPPAPTRLAKTVPRIETAAYSLSLLHAVTAIPQYLDLPECYTTITVTKQLYRNTDKIFDLVNKPVVTTPSKTSLRWHENKILRILQSTGVRILVTGFQSVAVCYSSISRKYAHGLPSTKYSAG